MLAGDELTVDETTTSTSRWWEMPSLGQLIELFRYTASGIPESEYQIIEYVLNCPDQSRKRVLSLFRTAGLYADDLQGGGGGGDFMFQDSARLARLLEIKLLLMAMDEEYKDILRFEDVCEELSIHFSIDVAIPEKFIESLNRIGGEKVKIALEISGLCKSDSESFVEDHLSGIDNHRSRINDDELFADTVAAAGQEKSPKRKKRLIMRRQSSIGAGGVISDARFQVELDRGARNSLDMSVRPSANGKTHNRLSTINNASGHRSSLASSNLHKGNGMGRGGGGGGGLSPQKRSKSIDPTIILNTPPKQQPTFDAAISRCSTPGYLEKVCSLSLDD